MYSTPGMFVVRGDSPHRSIADLIGKPVAFGAKGSGLVILARYVLDGLGYDMEKDFQAVYLDRAGDGPTMVQDGRVAALWGGGAGWPGFKTVMSSQPGGRFIAPSADEKMVKMAIVPAHHDLDDGVQPVEGEIGRHENPPPDQWLGVCQTDFDLEPGRWSFGFRTSHNAGRQMPNRA